MSIISQNLFQLSGLGMYFLLQVAVKTLKSTVCSSSKVL